MEQMFTQQEAYYVLSNLDMFVEKFERHSHKKVTPGALEIIQRELIRSSFPDGIHSRYIN